ncbi:hypothetical protein EVAR_27024_1 [Eumeta japonica]|uniref:Uncharacterized protein n=1 Tax=Eumeta variegata TaxID=151549 RepID=A0A4C1WFN8_EUMVA|nr:hypothetical protein EVAR_27024_1 [Eumeta japonica]
MNRAVVDSARKWASSKMKSRKSEYTEISGELTKVESRQESPAFENNHPISRVVVVIGNLAMGVKANSRRLKIYLKKSRNQLSKNFRASASSPFTSKSPISDTCSIWSGKKREGRENKRPQKKV